MLAGLIVLLFCQRCIIFSFMSSQRLLNNFLVIVFLLYSAHLYIAVVVVVVAVVV